ncbi:10 kDa heat shock protein, mitochondrial-like [Aethina tumida]|uniref:10 kDa heat shock protein, mitochondrial-like n=1 Tax=Aethina tumida TaxID=116153 RepID=UPI00096B3013|nr:10 kDa heat shock protein, mitochondrial-like [Aethina tumida]
MAAAQKHAATTLKTLRPLFNRVLIRKHDAPKETEGGIVLPDNLKGKCIKGTVVAVGPGTMRDSGFQVPISVKPGDDVLLPEYGGTKVQVDGDELFLYRESELLAKVSI